MIITPPTPITYLHLVVEHFTRKMRLEHLEYLQARQQTYDPGEISGDVTSPGVHEAVAQSPFYRLPYELRRKILIFAFGNYTYHVGVIDDRANRDPWFTDCKPECLKWVGDICRRDANEMRPFQDDCVLDPLYPSHFMKNIGVLGWLCSCRLGCVIPYQHAFAG